MGHNPSRERKHQAAPGAIRPAAVDQRPAPPPPPPPPPARTPRWPLRRGAWPEAACRRRPPWRARRPPARPSARTARRRPTWPTLRSSSRFPASSQRPSLAGLVLGAIPRGHREDAASAGPDRRRSAPARADGTAGRRTRVTPRRGFAPGDCRRHRRHPRRRRRDDHREHGARPRPGGDQRHLPRRARVRRCWPTAGMGTTVARPGHGMSRGLDRSPPPVSAAPSPTFGRREALHAPRRHPPARTPCQRTRGLPCGRTVDLPAGGQLISLSAVS